MLLTRSRIDECNTLHLKLQQLRPLQHSATSTTLADYQIPVLLFDISQNVTDQWDISVIRVLAYINGVNSIEQIAAAADMDLSICRQSIQHLLYVHSI